MLNNKQKGIYVLIGTTVGFIAGIYHLTLKEIISHEIRTDRSRALEHVDEKPETNLTK